MPLSSVVRAFIFNPEGKILLAKHKPNTPWVLPGGHVEPNETLHEAMKRELKEEFGIAALFFEIDDGEYLHHKGKKLEHFPLPLSIYTLKYKDSLGKDKSRIEYVFLMETSDTVSTVQQDEITEYQWFEVDDILTMKPNIETYDFIIEMLEKILESDEE